MPPLRSFRAHRTQSNEKQEAIQHQQHPGRLQLVRLPLLGLLVLRVFDERLANGLFAWLSTSRLFQQPESAQGRPTIIYSQSESYFILARDLIL